jgi:hypothetical protein
MYLLKFWLIWFGDKKVMNTIGSVDNTANIILLPPLISLYIKGQIFLISSKQILNHDILIKRQFVFVCSLAKFKIGASAAVCVKRD